MWHFLYSLLCVVNRCLLNSVQRVFRLARQVVAGTEFSIRPRSEACPIVESLATGWCPRRFLVEPSDPDSEAGCRGLQRLQRYWCLTAARLPSGPPVVVSPDRLLPASAA